MSPVVPAVVGRKGVIERQEVELAEEMRHAEEAPKTLDVVLKRIG